MTNFKRAFHLSLLVAAAFILSACSVLFKPAIVPQINTYTLDPSPVNIVNGKKTDLSILVQNPNMNPGFSTQRMVYLTKDFQIGYYTQNEWAGTPAEMLQPLISQALQLTGHYGAVVVPPYANFMDLELNTRILSFYQDFRSQPSHFHLRIVTQLLDRKTNTIIATHDFVINQNAEENTPYGGVIAANKAVALFLNQLTEFCVNAKSPRRD